MKELDYADFSLGLHEKKCAVPVAAQIELSFNCNLNCPHCYLGSLKKGCGAEMDYAQVIKIIDLLQKEGVLWLTFTGGEPMLRKDFPEIYRYASREGFLIMILTNGTLVNEEYAELFKEYPPFYLEIPLNAACEQSGEQIYGAKGSFTAQVNGLELLSENHIPFRLKTKVITLNLQELPEIKKLALGFGVPYAVSAIIHSCIDGDEAPLEYRITPSQAAELVVREDALGDCLDSKEEFDCRVSHSGIFRCAVIKAEAHIDPLGYLNSCVCLRKPHFDLKKGTLSDGVDFLWQQVVVSSREKKSACGECKVSSLCSACPPLAIYESGDSLLPVDYFCQLANLRDEKRKRNFA